MAVCTPLTRLTSVVGAKIPVVAVKRGPGRTDSGLARIADGTGIAIFTGQGLMCGHQRALPAQSVTGSSQTDGIDTLWFRTLHNRCQVRAALMRKHFCVANKGPTAKVSVLKFKTIGIDIALARNLRPGA